MSQPISDPVTPLSASSSSTSLALTYLRDTQAILSKLSTAPPSLPTLQKSLQNASNLISNLEMELYGNSDLSEEQRDDLFAKLKHLKKQLHEWRKKLGIMQKEALLSESHDETAEYGGQSRHYKEKLEKTSLLLNDSGQRLQNSLRMIESSGEQGAATMSELRNQRASLERSKHRLTEIDGEQRVGSRTLRRMEWRRFYNQIILISIIIVLILAIVFVFYFGILSRWF